MITTGKKTWSTEHLYSSTCLLYYDYMKTLILAIGAFILLLIVNQFLGGNPLN